jgi:hypothetical protein
MAEEREEEKVEEAPTTSAVHLTFDPKAGEVADLKQNPIMDDDWTVRLLQWLLFVLSSETVRMEATAQDA